MTKQAVWLITAVIAGVTLAGCGAKAPATAPAAPAPTQPAPPQPKVELTPRTAEEANKVMKRLTPAEVKEAIEKRKPLIIDVREKYEYDAGHIAGAQLIPLGEMNDRWKEIDPSQEVIFVCKVGKRSPQAAQLVLEKGFPNAGYMLGGMNEWTYDKVVEPGAKATEGAAKEGAAKDAAASEKPKQ